MRAVDWHPPHDIPLLLDTFFGLPGHVFSTHHARNQHSSHPRTHRHILHHSLHGALQRRHAAADGCIHHRHVVRPHHHHQTR